MIVMMLMIVLVGVPQSMMVGIDGQAQVMKLLETETVNQIEIETSVNPNPKAGQTHACMHAC
jgi:hypothetical protein